MLFNNVRCYLKTKEVKVLEDQKVKRDKNLLLKQMKEKPKKVDFPPIYAKLDDQEKYLYYKIPYEEAYAALLCNGPLQHYQDYLELTDTAFFTLISEQGIKYCYTHL